jgi:hypothetical protein
MDELNRQEKDKGNHPGYLKPPRPPELTDAYMAEIVSPAMKRKRNC